MEPIERKVKAGLPTLPDRMRALPLDARGFPIPWFVGYINGEPDFRCMDSAKLARCVNERRCWVCGGYLGVRMAFVLGPMCAVNRVVSEPPSHRECAIFSAKACPFLSHPRMRRNEKGLPEIRESPPGYHLDRNPGAVCVWVTRDYEVFRAGEGNRQDGVLFRVGKPDSVLWYTSARLATLDEALLAIADGIVAATNQGIIDTPEKRQCVAEGIQALDDWLPPPAPGSVAERLSVLEPWLAAPER